jgi:hypothetical protein
MVKIGLEDRPLKARREE